MAKKSRGRPCKPANYRKSKTIRIRLTAVDHARFINASGANKDGNLSAWVRGLMDMAVLVAEAEAQAVADSV